MDQVLIDTLEKRIKGEVFSDQNTMGMYATDASVYQIFPKAVVVPRDEEDVITTLKLANENNISILPRGAGTSLAGQTVGDSIVIDFSKYLNKILELNVDEKWVRVEPGLIHSELNAYLKPYNLIYGPDPATSTRANMGGIVANNSSGSRSIVFGKAIDHIISMKVALYDGEILDFEDIDASGLNDLTDQNSTESKIYSTIVKIVKDHKELIKDKFPKVMRRVSGYSLDEFVDQEKWNLSKLLCGSEGTLATILELKLNLIDLPKKRGVIPIHYGERMQAISEVKNLLPFGPSAVELLDDTVIEIAKTNPSTKDRANFIQGSPGAILIVEFFGDTEEELEKKFTKLKGYLDSEQLSYHYSYYSEGNTYNNIWDVRKKGLGLLLSMRSAEKPIPFIEDACVPVESLESYIEEILEFCHKENTKVILYAHASVGVLHVRPILDLRKKEDIEKFERIADHTLDLVIKYKGSWSGEHGDGISRSFGIPRFFGEEIYKDFVEIKNVFDPKNLMNPGKIVNASSPTSLLRYGTDYKDQSIETVYKYRKELGFDSLIHMCNGIGLCQRVEGGVMCPSYKASLDEKDSTRARANVLRLTLSNQINKGDFTNDELLKVLDLCVSCKSCKTECPSNVDIAKLKSEVMQMHYDAKGINLRGYFIQWSDNFSKWFSGPFAGLINTIIKNNLFRKVLEYVAKIDARRVLDTYSNISLNKWYKKRFQASADGKEVVLFADTYINFHQVEIGIAIIELLDSMNFRVILVDTGGSKRPLISNGFLKKAKKKASHIANELMPYFNRELPVIVCEPSAYSALVEDLPDLMDDELMGLGFKKHVISLEHFLSDFIERNDSTKKIHTSQNHHVIHGHCHSKAMEGMEFMHNIFSSMNASYEILDSGCCGMAGAFGFEKEHYDFSKKIFDNDLGKKIKTLPKDQLILATGFSCRHQIKDFSEHKVKHWVEIVEYS